MTWPDHISVYHKLRYPPSTSADSFILDVLILSERHQRPAARCIEDLVIYDYRRRSKTPLEGYMVGKFQEFWESQEAVKAQTQEKIKALFDSVVRLEKSTWDRDGAVEDVGNGSP